MTPMDADEMRARIRAVVHTWRSEARHDLRFRRGNQGVSAMQQYCADQLESLFVIESDREADGRDCASDETAEGSGCAATAVGALAELSATLINVEEDR